jgi:hypothetical protein
MRGLPAQERAIVSPWNGPEIDSDVQPIGPNPRIKESNESLQSSAVALVCWHVGLANFQRYMLNHGPTRPDSRESPPSTRLNRSHALACRRPSPIRSRPVTRPGGLSRSSDVQTPAIRVRAPAAPRSARVHHSRSTAGTLDVHGMCPDRLRSPGRMPPAGCPPGVMMARRPCISGKAGPLLLVVGTAPAADSAR